MNNSCLDLRSGIFLKSVEMFFGDGLLGRPARRLVPCLTGQPGTKIGPRDVPWADPWARSLFRPGTTARRAQSCRAHSCRADAGLGPRQAGPPVRYRPSADCYICVRTLLTDWTFTVVCCARWPDTAAILYLQRMHALIGRLV